MRSRLWACLLTVFVIGAGVCRATESWRLDPTVRPTFQKLHLKIDASETGYSGRVQIELDVIGPVTAFQFHAQDLTFSDWSFTGPNGAVEIEFEPGDDGFVDARSAEILPPGPYTLSVDFSASFGTRGMGLYRAESLGVGYVFSQFEPVHARTAFPCWDEPAFKIPFQVSLTVPEAHVAASNTPVESQHRSEGWKTLVFKKTRPMSTYLLAFASGPLESVPITGLSVPGRIYTVAGQSSRTGVTVEVAPSILAAMEQYFGIPYPYAKLDFVAVPEFAFGAMENAGLITFKEQYLLLDPKSASADDRRHQASIIAHEVSHMWFGDMVTMEWWDDLWLNEAFANFVGDKISEQLFPEYQFNLRQRRAANSIMSYDTRPSTIAIRREVNSAVDIMEDVGLAYQKGQHILGMIENWIGETAFQSGIQEYLETHAWGNATAQDLWSALSKTSQKELSGIMACFLDQPGVPLVDVVPTAKGTISISQNRFLNFGIEAPAQRWTIPVSIRYAIGEDVHSRTIVLDGTHTEIVLGEEVDWLNPNVGGFGYYRWRMPAEEMRALATRATVIMSPPERVAFVGNAAALLDGGSLSGADFLEILGEFGRDPEPVVVSAVLNGLEKSKTAFVTAELETSFAAYVRSVLTPAVERFGLEPQPGEDDSVALLRPDLLDWMGIIGQDQSIRAEADRLARAYMTDPASIDASLASVALSMAAIDGDRELFDTFIKHYETDTDPISRMRFLSALGSFFAPALREAALDYILTEKVRPTDIWLPMDEMYQTDEGADAVFGWIRANYDAVASKAPSIFVPYLSYFAGGCSAERLKAAQSFFAESEHQVDGTLTFLGKVTDEVTDCINLRIREGASVAASLQSVEANR